MQTDNNFQNQLYYGDNLEIIRKNIADESIDLCYIDPPFNSQRNYNQIYNNIGKEDTAQVHAFIDTWTWNIVANEGYDAIISNYNQFFTMQTIELIMALKKILGKGPLLAYIVSLTLRIVEIHRVLKPTGSFYLHCDPTASHYLKLILDSVFVSRGGMFRNEISWCYRRWSSTSHSFQRMHDIIFFYTKSQINLFNRIYIEATEGQKKKHTKGWDVNTTLIKGQRRPNLIVYDKEKVESAVNKGKINLDKFHTIKYIDKLSTIMPDWWEIPIINSQAKERLGYPTQKPEALLERIIKASSNEGDLIFDAYCGCGTTIAVAQRLNRKWIGIDISYQSISLILKRLEDTFGKDYQELVNSNKFANDKVIVKGVPRDMNAAIELANRKDDRLRKEFEKWAILTYTNNMAIINEKNGGDGGIDGIAYIKDIDANDNIIPQMVLFNVKSNMNLTPSVIRDLYGTIEREGAICGILLTLYPMNNLEKEAKKYGVYEHKLLHLSLQKIQVVNVESIIKGERMKFPAISEVLKNAERKYSIKQQKLL